MLALIIIDQQKGIDHPKLGERNNRDAEQVISSLLERWRTLEWPVFHVRHRSTNPDSVFWPEQEGVEFKEAFIPRVNERVITKSVPCAFIKNTLEEELRSLELDDIVILGVATNNSVEATARTGGNLGFNVYVVADGCFTFSKVDYAGVERTAEEVHAMSLANLDGEYAKVISSGELIKKVEGE